MNSRVGVEAVDQAKTYASAAIEKRFSGLPRRRMDTETSIK